MTDPSPLDSDDLDRLRKRVQHEHLFLSHVMTETAVDLLDALAAERARADAAEGKVARVEALADPWNATPDYTVSDYDMGRVDQRHDMAGQLLAALADDSAEDT